MLEWLNAGVRFVLKVPFHEKEQAKQMGCRWINKQWCYDYDMKKECSNFEDLIGWKWVKDNEAIHFFEIVVCSPYGAFELSEKEKRYVNDYIFAEIQSNISEYRANYNEMKQQQKEAYDRKLRDEGDRMECERLCKEQGITGKEEKTKFLQQYRMERALRRRIWEIVGDSDDDKAFENEMQRFLQNEIARLENP